MAAILKLSWQQAGRVYVTSFCPTHSSWEMRNLQLTWRPPQGQQNQFLRAIIHFTIFNGTISEFGASLAQNNMVCWKPFRQNFSDGVIL